ncbi:MAG: EamA family transporter [Candidatus Lokiarchaeota archaeon]|nr:EamA family transporter [Candidatus Lokiarchaeota archaeon]
MSGSNFSLEIISIMTGYAVLNGLGSLCFKVSLKDKKGELDSFLNFKKGWLKNLFNLVKKPFWLLGVAFLVSDFFVYQLALKKYEISVVKPLVNLNLIFVLFFGVVLMKEKITKREILGIILIMIGGLLITYRSRESTETANSNLLITFSLIAFFITFFIIFYIIRSTSRAPKRIEILGSIISGLMYGLGAVYNKAFYNPSVDNMISKLLILGFFAISYALAFLYGQYSYSEGRMSIVSVIVNITSVVVPFIGGAIIFDESIILIINESIIFPHSYLKIIALTLILIGILCTSFNPSIPKIEHDPLDEKKKEENIKGN